MVSILNFQKMMVFGAGKSTLQQMLNILVEILSGQVMPTNFPKATNYLMEAHCPMAQR
jgi:ABC-type proline/glycine betaine transport system ATPase subunit